MRLQTNREAMPDLTSDPIPRGDYKDTNGTTNEPGVRSTVNNPIQ